MACCHISQQQSSRAGTFQTPGTTYIMAIYQLRTKSPPHLEIPLGHHTPGMHDTLRNLLPVQLQGRAASDRQNSAGFSAAVHGQRLIIEEWRKCCTAQKRTLWLAAALVGYTVSMRLDMQHDCAI